MEEGALRRLAEAEERKRAAALVSGWEETLICSALNGAMGSVWALKDKPESAIVTVCGDFVFFAGEPDAALVRAYHMQNGERFSILTPQNEAWGALICAEYGEKAVQKQRYSICREKDCFDPERLEEMARSLPEGMTLRFIDDELYEKCLALEWARDFVSQFASARDYAEHGLGVVALQNGELTGGASSYVYDRDCIEIEVDTREDMRRKGIATACCARLILACLQRGLYPSWDAANLSSVGLAQKLGYHEKGEYTVYHVNEGM